MRVFKDHRMFRLFMYFLIEEKGIQKKALEILSGYSKTTIDIYYNAGKKLINENVISPNQINKIKYITNKIVKNIFQKVDYKKLPLENYFNYASTFYFEVDVNFKEDLVREESVPKNNVYNFQDVPTKFLVDELIKRGGVAELYVEPHQPFEIKFKENLEGKNKMVKQAIGSDKIESGPCTILVVYD